MSLVREVVNTTYEFDRVAINKLVNEELNKVLYTTSTVYISLDNIKNDDNQVSTTVKLSVTFIQGGDLDISRSFSHSFKLNNNMSETYVRSVVRNIMVGFAESLIGCIESDIEDMNSYLNIIKEKRSQSI